MLEMPVQSKTEQRTAVETLKFLERTAFTVCVLVCRH